MKQVPNITNKPAVICEDKEMEKKETQNKLENEDEKN